MSPSVELNCSATGLPLGVKWCRSGLANAQQGAGQLAENLALELAAFVGVDDLWRPVPQNDALQHHLGRHPPSMLATKTASSHLENTSVKRVLYLERSRWVAGVP